MQYFLQYMPKSISESANKLFCWKIMSFGERWPAPARRAFHSSCWLRTAPSWHRPYGPWLGQRFNWAGWLLFWPYNFHLTSYILRGSIEIFHSQFSINQSINQLINQSIILLCNEPPRRLWQPVEENCTNSHHCRDDLSWVEFIKSTKYYSKNIAEMIWGENTLKYGLQRWIPNTGVGRWYYFKQKKNWPEGECASPWKPRRDRQWQDDRLAKSSSCSYQDRSSIFLGGEDIIIK